MSAIVFDQNGAGSTLVFSGDMVKVSDEAAVRAEEAAEVAELAAEVAETFGWRNKATISDLESDVIMTAGNTPLGSGLHVNGVGDFIRVTSGGDVLTAGGLQFIAATTSLSPAMFNGDIADAIEAASLSGRALVGVPGMIYTFTRQATATGPLTMFMNGCQLVRGAAMTNTRALLVEHDMSAATYAASDTIVGYTLAEYNFGNGSTTVPRIELSSVVGYSVGGIVKVMSPDKIPSIESEPGSGLWINVRYSEMGQIGAIVGNYLYLIRPFSETWTPAKIARMSSLPVIIGGGEWYDEVGYPSSRNQPMVELRGCVRPDYRNMHFRDTASTQLAINNCYEPVSAGNRFDRPRHSPANTAYGYGEKIGGGTTRPFQSGAIGTGCRHVFDTIGFDILDANVNDTHPRMWGGTISAHVKDGVGFDSLNAPFCDHPDAYGTFIENCSSQYTNRRSPGSTLWGLELRGRSCRAKGGFYAGLAPIFIQPSTTAATTLEQVTARKDAVSAFNVGLEPLVNLNGTGIIGGGRGRVDMIDVRLEQVRGRKEVILAQSMDVNFSGSVKVNADLNVTPVFALDASSVNILRLFADYSQSSANQPVIASIRSAGCSVYAPGPVSIYGSTSFAGNSQTVLVSFAAAGGDTPFEAPVRFLDVSTDNTLFGSPQTGLRFPPTALDAQVVVRRSDTGLMPNDIVVNFSSGSGAKPISWPVATAHPMIYAAVNPTTTGTFVGTIPNGAFSGQRLILTNVGGFSFEVQTSGNISVGDTRVVAIGATQILRWNGTSWTG